MESESSFIALGNSVRDRASGSMLGRRRGVQENYGYLSLMFKFILKSCNRCVHRHQVSSGS